MLTRFSQIKKVVDGDFCVGCGSCAFVSGTAMKINQYGEYVPQLDMLQDSLTNEIADKMEFVCPSLTPEQDETVIAEQLFKDDSKFHEPLGYYQQSYAAFSKEEDFREKGTSGGMGTWVAVELMRRGLVDGVIHVKQSERNQSGDPFYKYSISRTECEIREASKTRYHVIEMTEVLDLVSKSKGKFVFIGVPCMVKSIRRLQLLDSSFKEKISFVFSLVCGHLKSINWSLSLAWGAGIPPEDASSIQYRTKGEGIPARAYVFRAEAKDGKVIQKDSAAVIGGKFNAGALMLPACEFCDDVIGETSDLTIGDAWLPRFEVHEGGTNLLVVRNREIHDILMSAKKEDRIELYDISADEAVASQSGGYRQRREGLSYRLERELKKGKWVPTKRIKPGDFNLSKARKKIYDQRSEVTTVSRELFVKALKNNDYSSYQEKLGQLTKKLRRDEILNMLPKVLMNKAQRIVLKFLSKIGIRS